MFEDELTLLNQSINEFGDKFRNGLSDNPGRMLGLRDAFKDSLRALSEKLSLKLKEEEKMVEMFLEYQTQLLKQNTLIQEKKDSLLKMISEVKNKKEELEGLTANIQNLKEEYCRKKETISTANKANGERLKRLQTSADLYRDHLGLEIRKIHGDKLQFIFTGIDPKKPESPYMFSLSLNEAKDYEVSDCSPPLECLAELQEKVRKTNNFSAFLANVRKAFIATVHN
ncbi:Kinetochore protein Spc25 [Lemmus lemmus]